MQDITTANFPLPTLGARLKDLLRELLEGRGFFMLRGLPVERLGLEGSAIAYLGIGRHFGSLRSSNARGHLLGHVKDVAEWLGRHGIEADALVLPARGADASRLGAYAREEGVDLLVAGAYGHNRLREWVFGGVTSDLLLKPDCCVLLSH